MQQCNSVERVFLSSRDDKMKFSENVNKMLRKFSVHSVFWFKVKEYCIFYIFQEFFTFFTF